MARSVDKVLFLAYSWIVLCNANQDLKLPSYIDVCFREDPNVADCIKRNIQKLVPIFKSGSTDFELAPLDPLEFLDLVFEYDSPILGGALTVPRILVKGIKDLKVVDVRPKVNDSMFLLEFHVIFPQIVTFSNYSLKGNVLSRNVHINGRIDVKYENLTITYRLNCGVKQKNKQDYLFLKLFSWRFYGDSIQKMTVLNDDLVEGRPVLNNIMKGLLKTAWRPLMNQMLPAIFPSTDKSLTQLFTKFFSKYPYNILFPKKKS